MIDWENLYKWLEGKLTFQAFIVGATLFLMLICKLMISSSSSSSSQKYTQRKTGGRLYAQPPEVCYCHSCGARIDMKAHGLYGKHCREITCPYCGSSNVWRAPP